MSSNKRQEGVGPGGRWGDDLGGEIKDILSEKKIILSIKEKKK